MVLETPFISGIEAQPDGTITLTWTTLPGQSYQAQYRNRMSEPVWRDLGEPIQATSASASVTDSMGPGNRRFYRIVQLPSPAEGSRPSAAAGR